MPTHARAERALVYRSRQAPERCCRSRRPRQRRDCLAHQRTRPPPDGHLKRGQKSFEEHASGLARLCERRNIGAERDVDIEAVAAAGKKRVELGNCELGMKPIGCRVITTAGDERPPHFHTLRSVRHGQRLSMGRTYHMQSCPPAGLNHQKRLVASFHTHLGGERTVYFGPKSGRIGLFSNRSGCLLPGRLCKLRFEAAWPLS